MLCNKARLDWARDGDRNSKYFHAVIRERRKRKLTQLTLANGDITTSPSEIGRLAVEFFSDLFTASPYHLDEELFANIQPRVSPAEDQIFNSLPTMEEISETIKQLNPSSSPGNDGFTGYFYRSCWEIIQADVYAFIVDFFKGAYLPRPISATTLVLLPKMNAPRQLGEYRPISLSNFSGKIISKILANRLAQFLPHIVDEEQAGFVHGRQITHHIVLAQEMLRDLSRKVTGANVVLKVDMAKAYDRLEWRFLLRAIEAFGFSAASRDLVYRNICNIWYQFKINGELSADFRSFRGVRQGDPLSPLLFVLAQQVLSTNLKAHINSGIVSEYKVGGQALSLSHLFYADDVLFFTNGSERSLRALMKLLQSYSRSSGQLINYGKSGFFYSR